MTLTRSLSDPIVTAVPSAATKTEIHSNGRNTTTSCAAIAVITAMIAPERFRMKMSATNRISAPTDRAKGAQPKTAEVARTSPSTPGAGYPQKPAQVAEKPTRPKEFICPEWSKFSEIPLTTRPVIRAAKA